MASVADLAHGTGWAMRTVDSVLRQQPVAGLRWRYEDGFLVHAIANAGTGATGQQAGANAGEQAVLDYAGRFVTPDGGIDTYRVSEYSLDQVMPGRVLFRAYAATGDERYRRALELLRRQLCWQPRTHTGGLWHKLIYPHQMWLDGIYMASPFLAQYAVTCDEPAALDDVAHQIRLLEQHTRDPQTGLLYHAWDESAQQTWCDPRTGCSPNFWARAIGWYIMALVDVLDYLPLSHPQAGQIVATLERTLAAVLDAADPETGLWWQLLDQPRRPGNYLEASAACMFVYALAKGVRRGYLPPGWRAAAERGYRGILQHFVQVDAAGEVALHWICGTAGLGGIPYRDGSFAYYVSERVVTNDPKGVAAFILAAAEMERAGP